MGKVVYMALQKEIMMKTIKFNAPCHIGDTVYYVWARKKNNKYTFKMKKRVAYGFLIENFRQCVCVKDKSGTDRTIDVPMHCVSTEKDVAKAVYDRLVSDYGKKKWIYTNKPYVTPEIEMYAVLSDDNFSESISVKSEYELGERFVNRYKEQDAVTGILVKNENDIASVLGEDGGVYSFLELERD